MKRHAARKFDGKNLPEGSIGKLFDLIRYAPTSFNIQPFKVKVVTDQKVKGGLMAASWGQPQVGTASHVLVFCADTDVEGAIDRLQAGLAAGGMPSEALSSYVGMVRGFAEGLQGGRRLAWCQKQSYIALGNAMNGATSLGFDSCPMEGFDPAQYSKILELPANLVPSVVCPVGYAPDKPRGKFRFPQKEIFF